MQAGSPNERLLALEKELAREQLTSRFYKQCEDTAQLQIAALNKELTDARTEAAKQIETAKKAEAALAVSQAAVEHFTAQCRLLQSDMADRGKQFENERLSLLEQISAEKAKAAKVIAAEDTNSKLVPVLESQVKVLSDVLAEKSEAHAAFALQCSREFDAIRLEQQLAAAEASLRTTQERLDHTNYLYREERVEGQRTSILCSLYRTMLDAPRPPQPVASSPSKPLTIAKMATAAAAGGAKEDAPQLLIRAKMEELVAENATLKRNALVANNQLNELRALLEESVSQGAGIKKELENASLREASLEKMLAQQRADEAVRMASLTQRELEQGAVVGLLSSCLMQPLRCPHCHFGLGDTVGLEMVAASLGLPSVDAVLEVMVESMAEAVSRTLHHSLTDVVTRVAPAVTLSAATGLASQVPEVVMFLPPLHFARFISSLGAVSEAQCYALAVRYMTTGARFQPNHANVDAVLDAVRFLWLPTALVESEIARIEAEMAAVPKLTSSLLARGVTNGGSSGCGGPAAAARHAVSHGLLLRLIQTLRFRSAVVQAECLRVGAAAAGGGAAPQPQLPRAAGGFLDYSSSSSSSRGGAVVSSSMLDLTTAMESELHRIRHSYGFVPTTMRSDIRGGAISTAQLLSLQLICI